MSMDDLLGSRAVLLSVFAFLAAVSIIYNGYFFNGFDNSYVYAFVNKILDPSLYPKDAFMTYAGSNYFSFFPYALAGIKAAAGLAGMQVFMLSILFAARFFVFYLVYKIAMLLFKNSTVALLACLLFISPKSLLGTSMFYNFTKIAELVFPVLLLSIYLFLKGKYKSAFAVAGLSFNLHPIYTAAVFLMLGFAVVAKRIKLSELAKYALVFAVAAAPMALWFALAGQFGTSAQLNIVWVNTMKMISWGHYDPASWNPTSWLFFLAFPALWAFYLLDKRIAKPGKELHGTVMLLAASTFVLCAATVFFTYIVPSRLVMMLMFFQTTKFLMVFMLIYIANYLYSLASMGKHGSSGKDAGIGLVGVLAVATYMALLTGQSILVLLALPLFCLMYAKRWRTVLKAVIIFEAILVGMCVIFPVQTIGVIEKAMAVAGYEQPATRHYYAARVYSLLLGDSIEAMVMIAAALPIYYIVRKTRFAVLVMLAALVIFAAVSPTGMLRMQFDQPEIGSPAGERAWTDVQLAAKGLTPNDALILTPPYLYGFRIYSEHSQFATLLDGGQGTLSNPAYAPIWLEREKDLGYTDIRHGFDPAIYKSYDEAKLAQLAESMASHTQSSRSRSS